MLTCKPLLGCFNSISMKSNKWSFLSKKVKVFLIWTLQLETCTKERCICWVVCRIWLKRTIVNKSFFEAGFLHAKCVLVTSDTNEHFVTEFVGFVNNNKWLHVWMNALNFVESKTQIVILHHECPSKKLWLPEIKNIETAHSEFSLTKQKFQNENKKLIISIYWLAQIEKKHQLIRKCIHFFWKCYLLSILYSVLQFI